MADRRLSGVTQQPRPALLLKGCQTRMWITPEKIWIYD